MKTQQQTLLPSCHVLEIFMPYRNDEKRVLEVLKKIVDIGYYRGVELGVFFDRYNRMYIREIIEKNDLNLTVFATPYLKERKMSLSSLDAELRNKSVEYTIELVKHCADTGCTNFGIPSGDDPGDQGRKEAKIVLADSMARIAAACAEHDMNVTLEPLDRYAFKKQLIGPMMESMIWFKPIHDENPNAYIHWDSAHEALGKTDLQLSLGFVEPFLAQMHLTDAILDPNHPCYGDLHMDVAEGPDFVTEGFLTPQIGAEILQTVASFKKPEGVKNTFVSVEVLGHAGDDLWHKEKTSRLFLQECFRLAEV